MDKIGVWSVIKHEIISEYLSAYCRILHSKLVTVNKKEWCKGYEYIDAFSGDGLHLDKRSGEVLEGSPLRALKIEPSFTKYHFIDLDSKKIDDLKKRTRENPSIRLYKGDCNKILIDEIFPDLTYDSFKRAVCILDPYGLHLNWNMIKKAAEMNTIDVFVNFPVMDINRNIMRAKSSKIKSEDNERMLAFWGDESWKDITFESKTDLFGYEYEEKIGDYKKLADEYRKRLKSVAGFKYVVKPIKMTNKNNGPLYYLYFASQHGVAIDIVRDIFKKYSTHMLK
ncbi:MAG: three-Cys-motif partner protein TcmP [Nitrospirae bacterium]|nr:three-Cys-motif partner protein TcmP [Nitrospirota bacterium]